MSTSTDELPQFETSTDTCVICLATMEDLSTRSLECGHVFHTECLDYWELNSNLCPCCRKDMKQPLVALRDTLKVLNDAICTASKATLKLKTISNNAQVGHLPMTETTVKNIEEFQNNLALVAPIIVPPVPSYNGGASGSNRGYTTQVHVYEEPAVDLLRSLFRDPYRSQDSSYRSSDPVVQQHQRLSAALRNTSGWPFSSNSPFGFF